MLQRNVVWYAGSNRAIVGYLFNQYGNRSMESDDYSQAEVRLCDVLAEDERPFT